MKKTLLVLYVLVLIFTLSGCSNILSPKINSSYYYRVYPEQNSTENEFMKYFENGFNNRFIRENIKNNNALSTVTSIPFRSMGSDVLEVTFLNPIKINYKNVTYNLSAKDIKKSYLRDHRMERHYIEYIVFKIPKENRFVYYDLDDKNSHFILDMGKIKLKTHNYKTNKVTEKIVTVPPLVFKIWANIRKDTSDLESFFLGRFYYTDWAENYEGELPLPDGIRRNK